MNAEQLPNVPDEEVNQCFSEADQSIRKRFPKILHNQGDYHNKVINFVLDDSYMQPHLHPGDEKIEKMYLLEGSFALIIFDDAGAIIDIIILEKGGRESIDVPAFTWHTYVMLTNKVIVYETMEGIYSPSTWKEMAPWAPLENTPEALAYLETLKNNIRTAI